MRGSVPGLLTPYPIGEQLPSILQSDEFAMRWTAGLDDVLAPVVSVLDCIDAYVDPALAPWDFLLWLAEWVGAVVDENWMVPRQRLAIATAVSLHRARGTLAGLRAQLELVTGGSVELTDSGGVTWSTTPGSDSASSSASGATSGSGSAEPHLLIRVAAPAVNVAALESIVAAAKPAHLPHTIEVVDS